MVDLSRFSLEGKVALVTGGSRGIGRATAIGFAQAGADVVISSRKQADLDNVAGEIRKLGRKALPVAAHIGRMENIQQLVDKIVAEFGRLDILVNNAGTSPAMAIALDTDERLWDSVMNLNLKGLYFLSQAAARVMKNQGGGKIINVSSVDGYHPQHSVGIYSIAKAAVIMVTKSMAMELGPFNIRVNAIAPGAVDTKLLNSIWGAADPEKAEEAKKWLAQRIPLQHVASPDEMVGAMIFLASDASSYVTGETILVDGGSTLM